MMGKYYSCLRHFLYMVHRHMLMFKIPKSITSQNDVK